jgi:hypothetical protein
MLVPVMTFEDGSERRFNLCKIYLYSQYFSDGVRAPNSCIDHLYEMRITSVHHPLLFLSVLDILQRSVFRVVERLQHYYVNERQIFISLVDSGEYSITARKFNIEERAGVMSDIFVRQVFTYLRLDNGVPLHRDIKVIFKVSS